MSNRHFKYRRLFAFFVLLAGVSNIASAQPVCRQEHAKYTLAGEPSYTLSFVKVAPRKGLVNDLLLHIRIHNLGKDYWYYFDEGSDPSISLISTVVADPSRWAPNPDGGPRPFGTAKYLGLYRDGRLQFSSPLADTKAPLYIVIPEFAAVMKHQPVGRYNGGAFKLRGCA